MSVDQPERGDEEERPDIIAAMATHSGDEQNDDETGGDAAAGARTAPHEPPAEDEREAHGPV